MLAGERGGELAGSVLWGLGRAAAQELRDLPVRLVDLDPGAEDGAEALAGELLWPDGEAEVAWRGGRRRTPRLVRTPPAAADAGGARPSPARGDRSYLVTGGLGGLGLAVAGWLLEEGAGAVVLNGRRAPDGEAAAAVERLRAGGAEVRVEVCDVTDESAVAGLVSGIGPASGLPPLGGVIHSVGTLADAAFGNQDWERFERVLWPKVMGAWHLHRETRELDLDLFVLFSSFAGLTGSAGQANHAAANAFLDQLALYRRSRGLPGQAIQWGVWSGLGEADEARERIAAGLRAAGVEWMTPGQGLRALGRVLREDAPSRAVVSLDWTAFGKLAGRGPGLLSELAGGAAAGSPPAETDFMIPRLEAAPPEEREALLLKFVRDEIRSLLRLPSPPPPDTGFFDLGMDSLTAVEFRNRLNRGLAGALSIPNTALFDHPSARALARHLAGELGEAPAPSPPAPSPLVSRQPARPRAEDPVAIVGMACRFPGAPDLRSFWDQLRDGRDAVTRGRPGAPLPTATPEEADIWGAYLSDVDSFDAGFFGILADEARLMDPQQRLLLETTWHALEDANLPPASLWGSRTGVYAGVGVGGQEYVALVDGSDMHYSAISAGIATSPSTALGRIAYVLGLEGPAVSLDTACSSSLVALHQAVLGLQRGDADVALAGGVNVTLGARLHHIYVEAGMVSPSGQSLVFDARADGYVRGEGCGMVVLRRLADAEASGDRILAVVRGSAVNQDGGRAAIAVPNGRGQERVMAEALGRSGIEPAEVDYLEAHGVGSRLGDPIEARAVAAVYGRDRPPDRPLLMGAVKANIGHLEHAAGVAAVIKAVLAMQARFVPPLVHFQEPNPDVAWDRIPVRVTPAGAPWPEDGGRPPRAAVSAFSLSGTNAHAVIEGYGGNGTLGGVAGASRDLPARLPDEIGPRAAGAGVSAPRERRLVPLSGRSPAALRAAAGRYLHRLEETADAEGAATWRTSPGRRASGAAIFAAGRASSLRIAGTSPPRCGDSVTKSGPSRIRRRRRSPSSMPERGAPGPGWGAGSTRPSR